MSADKQIIFDVYEFQDGFLVEVTVTDNQSSNQSKKKIIKTLEEVEEIMRREYIDFSLGG
jgi:hypothetical protein